MERYFGPKPFNYYTAITPASTCGQTTGRFVDDLARLIHFIDVTFRLFVDTYYENAPSRGGSTVSPISTNLDVP
jgi:hypothetical protein